MFVLIAAIAGGVFLRKEQDPGYRRWETREGQLEKVGNPGDETHEAQTAAEQYAQARTAPGIVLPGAYGAAFASLQSLPATGGNWTEVTVRPYNSDDPRYRDPFYSNSSGGSGLVAGRTAAIVIPTITWLAALVTCPAPASPTSVIFLPIFSKIGRARSKAACAPPTMIVRDACSAPT